MSEHANGVYSKLVADQDKIDQQQQQKQTKKTQLKKEQTSSSPTPDQPDQEDALAKSKMAEADLNRDELLKAQEEKLSKLTNKKT